MAKKAFKILIALSIASALALVAAVFPCVDAPSENKELPESRFGVLELRGAFRNSSLVVEGECVNSYVSAMGTDYSDYSVIRTLAGGFIESGRIITVLGKDKVGEKRLLYLSSLINDVHSENKPYYNTVDGGRFEIDDRGFVILNGRTVPAELIEKDIELLERETLVPSKYFYYESIEAMVKNCSSIFIGRVDSTNKVENADIFTNERGEVIMKTGVYTDVEITVLNGLAWQHKYGDKLTLRIIDDEEKGIIYSQTDEHYASFSKTYIPYMGEVCVFFVKKSPDEKAEHYFPINAYQGIIETNGDRVFARPENKPFEGISDLKELTDAIINASGYPYPLS